MFEVYFIYAQKIGTKSFGGKPWRIVNKDGQVCYGAHKGEDAYFAVGNLVEKLQKSDMYMRIVVEKRNDDNGNRTKEKLYDWCMDDEILEMRLVEYAEYQRKRKELKAKIKELEAQVAELDKNWG